MAESQQRWRLLGRWHDHWPWWLRTAVLAVLAVLAGMVWWRWGLAGLAVAAGIALVGWLIVEAVVMPGRLAPPVPTEILDEIEGAKDRLEAIDARTRLRHDLRNGPLQWLTVLAVLVGALLGFQQLAEDRDQAIQDRQLSRQGQASERFTRAIDQLGSSRLETRIGGIHGLSQIAELSPEENTAPVGEVLLAWLNGRPRPDSPPRTSLRGTPIRLSEHAPDVQAALTVLTGQRYSSIVARRLDLHQLYLSHAELRGANLAGMDMFRATLLNADLAGANLAGADLGGADLGGANLTGAKLGRANLENANLGGAPLVGADMFRATLLNADLAGANLAGADLAGADLYLTSLRNADLSGADLSNANLTSTDLTDADLTGADLTRTSLHVTGLGGAKVDGSTRWPPGFDWRRAVAEVRP